MAQVIWTDPAIADLDAIADYIALDNTAAARDLVARVVRHVGQLARHPRSGPRLPELPRDRFRQLIEPPFRIVYRQDGDRVLILHVMRGEQMLRRDHLGRG